MSLAEFKKVLGIKKVVMNYCKILLIYSGHCFLKHLKIFTSAPPLDPNTILKTLESMTSKTWYRQAIKTSSLSGASEFSIKEHAPKFIPVFEEVVSSTWTFNSH